MKELITKHKLNYFRLFVGVLLFALLYVYLVVPNKLTANWIGGIFKSLKDPYLNFISANNGLQKSIVLAIFTFIFLIVTFGIDGIKMLFGKPKKPVINFVIWFFASFLIALISATILKYLFKSYGIDLKQNPHLQFNQKLSRASLFPTQLFFEEAISFVILIVTAKLIYVASKSWISARTISTIITAIIFGLIHYWTYTNSAGVLATITQIILIQGVARIGFNEAGLRSNSIWVPYLIHIAYDLTTTFS